MAHLKQEELSVGVMNSLSLKLAGDFSLLFTKVDWDLFNEITERTLGCTIAFSSAC